jgi:HAD superfamily hydrolase (TIGR01549 family)
VQIIFANDYAYVTDVNPRIGTSAVMGNTINRNLLHNFFSVDLNQTKTPTTNNFKVVRFLDEIYIPKIDTSKIKGIVFDFDDTLISNKDFIIARCALLYEKEKYLFNTNAQTFIQMAIAFLNEGKAHKLIDCLCEHFNVDAHQHQLLESYRECFPDSLSIYNDVAHVLEQLHQKGLQLFVLTDNPVRTQEIKLNLFPHRHLFTKVYFTGAMQNQKPHADCFEIICKENNLLPEELAMVGDNQYRDIIGALDAGYTNAFYIKRSDSIVSHSKNIFTNYKNVESIITLQNLKQLLYHF